MLDVFLNVVLPIFVLVAVAALLQRWRRLSVSALSQVTFYLFSPALAFDVLVKSSLSTGASFRVVGATLLAMVFVAMASTVVSGLLRHPRPMRSAFLLSTIFPNAGNMALPVTLLALGEAGLAVAVVIFIAHSVVGWSVGTFIASRSEQGRLASVLQMVKVPAIYGVIAALGVQATDWELPTVLAQPIGLLAGAAIPAMLLVLGFHLGGGIKLGELPSLTAAMVLRLVVAAPLAYAATLVLGLHGVGQQTVVIVASMPTAVFTIILATQFGSNPRFITTSVVASTLASLGTLTVVVTLVQNRL